MVQPVREPEPPARTLKRFVLDYKGFGGQGQSTCSARPMRLRPGTNPHERLSLLNRGLSPRTK